ncbi:triose-phosphate isomerase [Brackiella oedipodis]|uniref:triose-phosphate isomerase n=1 Tax=Brackiella oedipodis TaxID=124225 RepID=UPI0006888EB1|nr:triose-phosphate isomerase [Brackiella oedipodis]
MNTHQSFSSIESQPASTFDSQERLVVGNWKMHGSLQSNQALLEDLQAHYIDAGQTEVVVCVPYPYLAQAQQLLHHTQITWGAQDLSVHSSGAYTSEVSASMLKDFACRWVIVGHSEVRQYRHDSDELVAQKAAVALDHSLTPIVCVGESEAQRQAGQTLEVIAEQLQVLLALGADRVQQMVIAYEPIWAIGTGQTATPEQAQAVHAMIRERLAQHHIHNVRLLYGGSVNASNAAALFNMPDIDGALVGGASLKAEEFAAIISA